VKLLSNVITFRFLGVNQLGADCAQLFFSVFAIGEVHAGTDIAEKSSIGTITRHAIMEQPSIGAVLAHQPVFQGNVLPRFKGDKILVHTTFSIFGMKARNPILLQLLTQR
jgi:hypothetical protein